MIARCRECYAILPAGREASCDAHLFTVARDSALGWSHVGAHATLEAAIGSVANMAGAQPFRVRRDGVTVWAGDGSDACDWVYEQQRAAAVSQ